MNHFMTSSRVRPPEKLLPLLGLSIALAGCITIEVPADSGAASEPSPPAAVRMMQDLGYTFQYHPDADPFWEVEDLTEGWAFRLWEDGSFSMSGQFDRDFDAQTEASIDFFESLGVTPDQAELTAELTVQAMGSSDGEASACERGLCCNAQVVMAQQIYIWFCSR